MSKTRLSTRDLDRIFRKSDLVGSRKFIKYGIKRWGLTFEASRNLLWRAIDDKMVRLNNHYQLERIDIPEEER